MFGEQSKSEGRDCARKEEGLGGDRYSLVVIPRTKPMPTPLAIPLSRLLRAHGISLILPMSSRGDSLFLGPTHRGQSDAPYPPS